MKLRPGSSKGTQTDLLVVGLGNPGSEYEATRHNAGQRVVEMLARRHGISLKSGGGRGHAPVVSGHGRVGQYVIALAVPTTFMNLSGEAMSPLMRRYDVDDLEDIVIVHDEIDLPVGSVRVKSGGGLAGHNGLKSMKQHLGSEAFTRVRIGVGRPPGERVGPNYVLKAPTGIEREQSLEAEERAASAVEAILERGITPAMNAFNK